MNIYAATSWRNPHHRTVVDAMRSAGHRVYDSGEPTPGGSGFSRPEIDPLRASWPPDQYRRALDHELAQRGFANDSDALMACDVCVFIAPAGRSAALEVGYAVGAGKYTAALIYPGQEPDLMFSMCDSILVSLDELLEWLSVLRQPSPREPHLRMIEREQQLFR